MQEMWRHETRVSSLGQEDLLEKEMATLSSILAWRILFIASLAFFFFFFFYPVGAELHPATHTFICRNHNLQYLSMRLLLETGPLKM